MDAFGEDKRYDGRLTHEEIRHLHARCSSSTGLQVGCVDVPLGLVCHRSVSRFSSSFLQVLGLNLVLSIFTRKNISENTKDALTKTQNELDELESQVVMLISSEFLSLVATLVFGFVIHVLGG